MYRLIGSVHTLGGLPRATADFLRSMDSLRKTIATDAGLSASELRAMARIAESEGVTPKQLADDLEMTTGAITAITNGLFLRSLIVRQEQSHDRRSVLLRLTDSGHEVMESAYRQFQDAVTTSSASLSERGRDSLMRGLNAVATEVERSKS